MKVATKRKSGHLPNGAIKIGTVAKHFAISVDLLRLYEREGLLIPIKSPRGTRYFTELDYAWIGTVLRLVREVRLNVAGIRRLLALLPCWQLRKCEFQKKAECPMIQDSSRPCWVNRLCCLGQKAQDCYFCVVYRSAPSCENLKALLVPPAEKEYPVTQPSYGFRASYFLSSFCRARASRNCAFTLPAETAMTMDCTAPISSLVSPSSLATPK